MGYSEWGEIDKNRKRKLQKYNKNKVNAFIVFLWTVFFSFSLGVPKCYKK